MTKLLLVRAIGFGLVLSMLGCSASGLEEPQPGNQGQVAVPQEGTASETPSPISLDDLDPLTVRMAAFVEVRRAVLMTKPAQDLVNHVFTENVNMKAANNAIEEIPLMAGFFADVATVDDYTIIWSGKGGSPEIPELACEEADFCEPLPASEYCNLGELRNLWVACQFNKRDDNVFRMPMFHGYTHLVQSTITPDGHMPSWFSEGPAQYFESHFSALHYHGSGYEFSGVDLPTVLKYMMERQDIVIFDKPATRKNILDAMLAMENRFPEDGWEQAQLGYYLGYLATEVLIATFGLEGFKEFWRQTATMDFYEAFEQEYGLTTKQFYKKFVPYALYWIEADRQD